MANFVIYETEHSFGMCLADDFEKRMEVEPVNVVKSFEATCWCAAQQVYAKYNDHEPYDMKFCIEDYRDNPENLCKNFEEQYRNMVNLQRSKNL